MTTHNIVREPWVRANIFGTGIGFGLILVMLALNIPLLWTLLLVAPIAVFGFVMLRKLDGIVGDPPWSLPLLIITVAVLLVVPLFPWQGAALYGLVAIAIAFGSLISYLLYGAWLKKSQRSIAPTDESTTGPTATPQTDT